MYSSTRRTYKPKKDTIGAIDPKDMLLCMDKKSSVFDAFYIQNIKQTKRELSCISSSNQYGTKLKKVRKRKFVKRAVKEEEIVAQQSTSKSTYLTPDKSIRVNKVLDPFDMLLNSSPVCQHVVKPSSHELFNKLKSKVESKKYIRKKYTKNKLHNNSSDSEKENYNESKLQNTTNVKAHKLLIEPDYNKPNVCNESIEKIVKNLSALSKKSKSPVFKTPIKYKRNRLTTNLNSPILKSSPLCSTPFREKYKRPSIKFSPIIVSRLNSPNMSVINSRNTCSTIRSVNGEEQSYDTPVECEETKKITFEIDKHQSDMDINEYGDAIAPVEQEATVEVLTSDISKETEIVLKPVFTNTIGQKHASPIVTPLNVTNNEKRNLYQSGNLSLNTTETEPFIGFSVSKKKSADHTFFNTIVQKHLANVIENNNYESSSILNTDVSKENITNYHINNSMDENKLTNNLNHSNLDSMHSEDINNDTLQTNNEISSYDICTKKSHGIDNPVVLIDKLSDSFVFQCSKKMKVKTFEVLSNSNDECQSYKCKEPMVLLDKLRDSLVYKYSESKKRNELKLDNDHAEYSNIMESLKEPLVVREKSSDSIMINHCGLNKCSSTYTSNTDFKENLLKEPIIVLDKLSDSFVFQCSKRMKVKTFDALSNNNDDCQSYKCKEPMVLLDKLRDSLVFKYSESKKRNELKLDNDHAEYSNIMESLKEPLVVREKSSDSIMINHCGLKKCSSTYTSNTDIKENLLKEPIIVLDKLSDSFVFQCSKRMKVKTFDALSNNNDECQSYKCKEPMVLLDKLRDSLVFKYSESKKRNELKLDNDHAEYSNIMESLKEPLVVTEKSSDSIMINHCGLKKCSSTYTSNTDIKENLLKEPIIVLDKLSDSMILKLYANMINSDMSTSHSNKVEDMSTRSDMLSQNESLDSNAHCGVEESRINISSDDDNYSEQSHVSNDTRNESVSVSEESDEKQNSTEYCNSSQEKNVTESTIRDSSDQSYDVNNEGSFSDENQYRYNSKQFVDSPLKCDSSKNSNKSNESCNSQYNSIERSDYSNESNQSSQFEDDYSIESDNLISSDEDKSFSFITTRKRNKDTNSLYMSLHSKTDDTNSLSISTECEKTVLSNKLSLGNIHTNSSINRQSLNSIDSKNESVLSTVEINTKRKTRKSSIKVRNLRKSRLSIAQNGDTESQDSIDKTDESEDENDINLYKIPQKSPVHDEIDRSFNADHKTVNVESSDNLDNTNVCMAKTTKETSDSDVITITETDSDDYTIKNNINQNKQIIDETLDIVPDIIEKPIKYRKTIRHSSFGRKSNVMNRKTFKTRDSSDMSRLTIDLAHRPGIVLQPGKKWERSLSIYRRMSVMGDFDVSLLDDSYEKKGRKYRESIINTMEMQDHRGSLYHDSNNSRRRSIVSKPNRSTICIVKDPDNLRPSLSSTLVFEDLQGFLNDECDDTIIKLSKLSLADVSHEVTVLGLHEKPERGTTAQDYVLRRCNQTDIIPFDECYPDTVLKNCHKIGEGVYGEVFLWRGRDGRARVMKIVPVAGSLKVNGENQKDYNEIISEIVIAMELSALRAPIAEIDRHFEEGKDLDTLDLRHLENATDVFNEVLAVRCVYGSYPSRLLDLWELYDECKGSENDNPAILPPEQQYIVLELSNAGQDLESYQFNNAEQAYALFLQALMRMQITPSAGDKCISRVAFGLAVAEEAYQFEHRDLHWGNVLIAPTDQKYASFVLRGRYHRVPRCGVAATIIDYSLSRFSFPLGVGSDRAALYNDLSTDDGLFDAVGDYQFEVYRLMRDKLGNDWKNFEPYTNILWLHYTVDKMITALRYKRVNTKVHKHHIEKLKSIKNRILSYKSATHFVLTDNEF